MSFLFLVCSYLLPLRRLGPATLLAAKWGSLVIFIFHLQKPKQGRPVRRLPAQSPPQLASTLCRRSTVGRAACPLFQRPAHAPLRPPPPPCACSDAGSPRGRRPGPCTHSGALLRLASRASVGCRSIAGRASVGCRSVAIHGRSCMLLRMPPAGAVPMLLCPVNPMAGRDPVPAHGTGGPTWTEIGGPIDRSRDRDTGGTRTRAAAER
jgi:hypothetical protein